MDQLTDFTALTPDVLVDAVEAATGIPLLGFAHPLNSYINRVYELQSVDGQRIIAKFYRPGRWSRPALQDEHDFVLECAAAEIPVVAPEVLGDGDTLAEVSGICFAVTPKRAGRSFEPLEDEDWRRLGRIVGRIHTVGSRCAAGARVTLTPEVSTTADVAHLTESKLVSQRYRSGFAQLAEQVLSVITPVFSAAELIRVHGDCHYGNILERPGEGLMVIDFDDMAMGPPVQDLWLLLPDRTERCERELGLILDGYTMFRDFDRSTLRLIEPLRAMRMLYFLAWCSKQVDDPKFPLNFPNWGTDAFWAKETADLREQLSAIMESLY